MPSGRRIEVPKGIDLGDIFRINKNTVILKRYNLDYHADPVLEYILKVLCSF